MKELNNAIDMIVGGWEWCGCNCANGGPCSPQRDTRGIWLFASAQACQDLCCKDNHADNWSYQDYHEGTRGFGRHMRLQISGQNCIR